MVDDLTKLDNDKLVKRLSEVQTKLAKAGVAMAGARSGSTKQLRRQIAQIKTELSKRSSSAKE
ncbi:MAG: 50S ribosomal protein L29 [Candidatus Nomurabacteria bacterium]|nr:50S ribosomal protein L29 [Candidatus Nomurabacteria bacterium]